MDLKKGDFIEIYDRCKTSLGINIGNILYAEIIDEVHSIGRLKVMCRDTKDGDSRLKCVPDKDQGNRNSHIASGWNTRFFNISEQYFYISTSCAYASSKYPVKKNFKHNSIAAPELTTQQVLILLIN